MCFDPVSSGKNLVKRNKDCMPHFYYVYIMTNKSGTLYTGVTNNLVRRVQEHRDGSAEGFTKTYKLNRLVYFEEGNDIVGAIEREKQIKGLLRKKKLELIKSMNPKWEDLNLQFQ